MNFRFFIFAILSISAIQNTMAATINLQLWDKETNTKTAKQCTVGGTIGTLPSAPKKTGYKFTGWKVQKYDTCSLCGMNSYTNGTSYYRRDTSSDTDMSGEALSPGEFIVNFQDGSKIRGKALCSSSLEGSYFNEGIPDETSSGKYCWCKATQRVSTNGTPCNTTFSSWMLHSTKSSIYDCQYTCAGSCANTIKDIQYFRDHMYSASDLRKAGSPSNGSSTYTEFSLIYNHGTITGKTLCSSTVGTKGQIGTPNETSSGQYCWCKLTSYKPTGCTSTQRLVGSSAWVAYGNAGSAGSCTGACGTYCNNTARMDTSFQNALLGN